MTFQPQLDSLLTTELSGRARIVQILAEFRREWQEATGGKSLLHAEAPIALILADIADKLELTLQERHVMLGSKLSKEINEFTNRSIA
jgi:hypothetical protein